MKKLLLSFLCAISVYQLKSQSPDLKTGVSFSYGYDQTNEILNLTWDFFNVGGGTANTFTIAYIASTDMTVDASDYLIDYKTYAGAVTNAFATITFTYDFSPGDLPAANYNLIVYIDYGNNVTESNETNNIVKFGTFNYTSVGIKENPLFSIKTNAYPNPAKEMITVSFESKKEGDFDMKLFDVTGKQVRRQEFENKNFYYESTLDLKGLTPGIYLLQVYSAGTTVSSKKIIVE